jgi:two-component system response regulator WspF
MKIGIVNDAGAADVVKEAVRLGGGHRVAWVARTEAELRQCCAPGAADLVLVNVHMTGLDGLAATRRIVRDVGSAVLLTVPEPADPARVFDAIGQGALDAVSLPHGHTAGDIAPALFAKIAVMARLIGRADDTRPRADEDSGSECRRLVAIGASAGGPAALAVVLGTLPRNFPAGIVVVQHLGEDFTNGVAEWLRRASALEVRVAREGDRPAAGTVLVAGGNEHLVFKSAGRLGYTAEPRDKIYRPSVDVFFQSVCRLWRGSAVGVLLTGMGRDGAQGLKSLRAQGHHTIAQDEATCAVYGMPKAAATLDAAVDILALDRIAGRLTDLVAVRRPERHDVR